MWGFEVAKTSATYGLTISTSLWGTDDSRTNMSFSDVVATRGARHVRRPKAEQPLYKQARDKKLRRNLKVLEEKSAAAAARAKASNILLENTPGFIEPETELERTYKVRQDEIQKSVAIETAQKRFDLDLPELGPYICEYNRNGRGLLLAGAKGHVATIPDWRAGKLGCELQLGETIRDARWLHNDQYFAVAQKQFVYIYDSNGVELHCLRKHREVTHMVRFLEWSTPSSIRGRD